MSDPADSPIRASVEEHREHIKAIVARHHGRSVALFGSVARGSESVDSDIDLLVEFEPGASLFDLVRIKFDVEELLRDVDVVSKKALLPEDDDVLQYAVPL